MVRAGDRVRVRARARARVRVRVGARVRARVRARVGARVRARDVTLTTRTRCSVLLPAAAPPTESLT